MPEERKKSFMQSLDEWTEKEVFYPIGSNWLGELADAGAKPSDEFKDRLHRVEAEVKKAIREKMLESYGAGARKAEARMRQKSTKESKGRSRKNSDLEF